MATWGVGVYDSDDGADWASEVQAGGLPTVAAALDAVRDTDYLDCFEAAGALVAADVVARLLLGGGGEQSSYAEPVITWIEDNPDVAVEHLVEPALAALIRVTTPEENELYDEWAASGELDRWLAVIDGLRSRLLAAKAGSAEGAPAG